MRMLVRVRTTKGESKKRTNTEAMDSYKKTKITQKVRGQWTSWLGPVTRTPEQTVKKCYMNRKAQKRKEVKEKMSLGSISGGINKYRKS